ncbi:MAG: TRAP transporter small permease [Burkholderiales bacterium]|nr:TRAP transporter small permease [Burkholderiales bacterium]
MITRFNQWVTRTLLVAAALLAFSLSFLVCADVIGRVVFNNPVKGTKEIVEISIVIICFLQAGYAIRSGGMLHVDVVTGLLPFRARAALVVLGALLGVFFFALIVWGSLEPFAYAWREGEYEGEGALRVPVWPARLAVLAGSVLAAFNYVLLAIEAALATLTGRPMGAMVDVGGRIH